MTRVEKLIMGLMVKRALRSRRAKGMLKGYVSKIGAALMIITGALQIAGLAPEVISTTVQGWDLIMLGLTTFGFARKLETIENK